jgi:plasmid maintenance system killer protein
MSANNVRALMTLNKRKMQIFYENQSNKEILYGRPGSAARNVQIIHSAPKQKKLRKLRQIYRKFHRQVEHKPGFPDEAEQIFK